jgi:hypothetical protein
MGFEGLARGGVGGRATAAADDSDESFADGAGALCVPARRSESGSSIDAGGTSGIGLRATPTSSPRTTSVKVDGAIGVGRAESRGLRDDGSGRLPVSPVAGAVSAST